MLQYIISISVLIGAVLLVRAFFKKSVPQRLIYALWLVVLVRICLPFSLFDMELTLPMRAESAQVGVNEPVLSSDDILPSLEYPSHVNAFLLDGDSIGVGTNPDMLDEIPPRASSHERGWNIDPMTIVRAILGTGTLLFVLVMAGSMFGFRLRLNRSRVYYDTEGSLTLYISDEVKTPCLYGLFPAIYLPSSLGDEAQIRLTVLHEKTHFCHGDHIWSCVRMLVLALFWWNPLIWAAAILSKKDAELACDESVARGLDDTERIAYARLIIDNIPEKRIFTPGLASAPIKERLLRLTRENKTRWISIILAALMMLVFLTASFTTLSAVAPEPDEPTDTHYSYVEGLHYKGLSERERELYDLLSYNLNDPRCVHLSLFFDEAAEYDAAYKALALDNPELAVLAYKHENVADGSTVTWKLCDAEEDFTDYSSMTVLEDMYAASYELVSRMPEGLDTRGKYTWLADSLCDLITPVDEDEYDYAYTNAGALAKEKAERRAYAFAYQMLCRDADLWCTTVASDNDPDETVNLIRLDDGEYYYMDTASADESLLREICYFMKPELLWGRDSFFVQIPSGMSAASGVMLSTEQRVNRLPEQMKIARSLLNKNEKKVYDDFEKKLLGFEYFNASFDGIAHEEIDNAIDALKLDYPELSIAVSSSYTYDSETNKWKFSLDYMTSSNRIDGGDADAYIKKVIYYADRIVLKMPESLARREKYEWLADYLLNSVEIVDPSVITNDERYEHAGGALLNRKANASALNSAYLLLCQRAGLWCALADTTASGLDTTVVVMLDDGYTYYMDIASAKTHAKKDCYFINDSELTALLGTKKSRSFAESLLVATAK